MSILFCCEPPFQEIAHSITVFPNYTPPLGSFLISQIAESGCLNSLPTVLSAVPPWLPAVITSSRAVSHLINDAVTTANHAFTRQSVILSPSQELPLPISAVEALSNRNPPSPSLIARWLALRLGQPDIESLIATIFNRDGKVSERTLRWRCQRKLHCHPSDLRRLVVLATLPRPTANVDQLAAISESSPQRMRERLRRGLGVTLAFYNRTPGWEWVLEAAIRKGLGAGGWAKIN